MWQSIRTSFNRVTQMKLSKGSRQKSWIEYGTIARLLIAEQMSSSIISANIGQGLAGIVITVNILPLDLMERRLHKWLFQRASDVKKTLGSICSSMYCAVLAGMK